MSIDARNSDAGLHSINLRWLVRLRFGAALGQTAVILIAGELFALSLPLAALFAVIGIELVTNLGCLELLRRTAVREWMLAAVMALDVLLLTSLLHLSGGSFNPFNFLYLVHIALAAVVLRPAYTWGLVLLSLASFGSLFGGLGFRVAEHVHHAEQMDMHLRGMWVAFAVAATFIVYFVGRVRRALSEREVELELSRQRAEKSERLAALGTLAAGAAHELGTPLATIAIAASELEMAGDSRDRHSVAEDAALIQEQVRRCRLILDDMAVDAMPGESSERVKLAALAESVVEGMRQFGPVEFAANTPVSTLEVDVPRKAVERAVRELIKNAIDASHGTAVTVGTGSDARSAWLEVRDRGDGMTAEVLGRAREPFFTTKGTGQGMGLGMYLTNALAEQLGGHIQIESTIGKGSTVRFVLPISTALSPSE